jgi:uncharacterized membrane protein YtjA (UPF0391 family)
LILASFEATIQGTLFSHAPLSFGEPIMLRWILIFLIIALVASVFGLGGLEGTALYIARILLVVFVVVLIVNLIMGRRPMA